MFPPLPVLGRFCAPMRVLRSDAVSALRCGFCAPMRFLLADAGGGLIAIELSMHCDLEYFLFSNQQARTVSRIALSREPWRQ